jgi:uncharacterized protein (DUF58 family)
VTRPTTRGLGILVVALATYLAARMLGTWELYLLSLTLLAAFVVAWVLVRGTARRLEAERMVVPDRPVAGDELRIALSVRNRSLLPGPQVTLEAAAGGFGDDRLELESMGSFAVREVIAGPFAARRGLHRLPPLRAAVEDPLGLARARRRLGEPQEVTVYPRLERLRSCALLTDLGSTRDGRRHGLPTLGGSEFRSVRPHNPGEPLSHIDWKATARTGALMLREMDEPSSGDLAVLLDGSSSEVLGELPDTNFELAVRVVGSLADFALRAGRTVTLLEQGLGWQQVRLTPDAGGRRALLESLARAELHGSSRLGPSLRALLGRGGPLVRTHALMLVVLSLDRELVHAVTSLRAQGIAASVVHVVGSSFVATSAPRRAAGADAETRGLMLALAAAGVRCLGLERGDDLRAVLGVRPARRQTVEVS